MNSAASEPALIGIDWGTSSLRAFLIGSDGEVLERVAKPQGIMHVANKDFEAAFGELTAAWMAQNNLPVIASGMITSRNGWVETAYVKVPAGAAELAASLTSRGVAAGGQINFITGMTTEHFGAPDVMRGEETQIIGACVAGMADGTFVMPGTHSKWITVSAGRIDDYSTYMTGEIFAAVKGHTILGALMVPGPFSEAGFRLGVAAGLKAGAGLLHELFHVRTMPLFDKIAAEMVEDYLSGMLIGAEIGGNDLAAINGIITIVGRSDLTERYEIALSVAGLPSQRAPEDVVSRGHFEIAKQAGLLR